MKPEDVPDEVMRAFINGASDSPPEVKANSPEWVRNGLARALAAYEATVLPAHERQVRAQIMTELFGSREEFEARQAEPVQVDAVGLCEVARPGEHERQVRERVAAEILALWPPDDPQDYEFVHAVTDYLRGVCHVCNEPLSAEPCTPRHADLARGKRGES